MSRSPIIVGESARKLTLALAACLVSALLGAALLDALKADEVDPDRGSPTHARAAVRGGGNGGARRERNARSEGTAKRTATPGSLVGNGELAVVRGSSPRVGHGPRRRFAIEVERGLEVSGRAFARQVERTLFDRRGWARRGGFSLQRVDEAAAATLVVILAGPQTTDRLCYPLPTNGAFSCMRGSRAVLNARRWRDGATAFAGKLMRYRRYLVNHEVGHVLGHGHRGCPAAGSPAPVMMQQTKGVASCEPNPWPLGSEG